MDQQPELCLESLVTEVGVKRARVAFQQTVELLVGPSPFLDRGGLLQPLKRLEQLALTEALQQAIDQGRLSEMDHAIDGAVAMPVPVRRRLGS